VRVPDVKFVGLLASWHVRVQAFFDLAAAVAPGVLHAVAAGVHGFGDLAHGGGWLIFVAVKLVDVSG
jgi:hypothetical protein